MRCGVYHTTEYIVVTTTGYLVVCGSHDGDEYDIDDKKGDYYGLNDSWEPEWHPSNSSEYFLEPNDKELIVPVTYKIIRMTSPRFVSLLIRAALHGMEKDLENK